MSAVSVVNCVARGLGEVGVRPGERLVVAVSGGVDSMVLLDSLWRLQDRLGLRLHVAHVHHGLRGKAADADAAFVIAEAARRGLGATVERLAPAERGRGTSLELWAREARYRCLEAVRKKVRGSRLVTAHTQNDQAETLLLNLLRGTGPRGLAGIPKSRERIIRPLLAVSRAEVEAYAASRRVAFCQDASNASDAYRRNRIRHHLLPQLAKEYNPRLVESLAALAALVSEDEQVLSAAAARLEAKAVQLSAAGASVEAAAVRSAPPALVRRVFQELFRRLTREQHALTRRHLAALQHLVISDGTVRLPGGLRGWRAGGVIRIAAGGEDRAERRSDAAERPLRPGAWVRWKPLDCWIRLRRVPAGSAPSRWKARGTLLSPRLLELPLRLRAWRPGDRFRPSGLGGRKKLQDFFMDLKVPRQKRDRVPLILAGDRIAWVAGYRAAEEFCWHGESTACLGEIRYAEREDALPAGPGSDHRG